MRRLIILAMVAFGFCATQAAQVTIDVPDGVVTEAQTLCEELRKELRISIDSWSNKVCAEEFFRRGLAQYAAKVARQSAEDIHRQSLEDARDAFALAFPLALPVAGRPDPPRIMACGDGTLDQDASIPYWEECDDGNTANDDGCDSQCQLEAQ